MSGKLKEVRSRISSVQNTQQITKAMKLVSAAKLRRAQEAILNMRPYANKLQTILGSITAALQGEVDIKLAEERPGEKVLLVLITSDRGLAGSYNSNLIKLAEKLMKEEYADAVARGQLTLMTIGKRGNDYFERRLSESVIDSRYVTLFHSLSFKDVSAVANEIIERFEKGEIDQVKVVYSEFKNAAFQIFRDVQYLPIPKEEHTAAEQEQDYIFEPTLSLMVEELIPKILRTQFYKFMLDANASEHGARMTAMDKATENASELLRDLKISYNRARQAAITTELTEIVSGAAALEDL